MRKFVGDYYQVQLEEFVTVVKKLYQFYSASKPASSSTTVGVDADASPAETLGAKRYSELESFLYDDSGSDGNDSNELDLYMVEPLLKQDSFDILAYWKNNTDKYPILSQIARDLMAIQVSTVASESAFSAAGRVLDPYCNRLDPEMVQALVCSKDWIHATTKGTNFLNCSIELSKYMWCTGADHLFIYVLSFLDRKYVPSIAVDLKPQDTDSAAPSAPLNDEVCRMRYTL
jgi:hypothetical protein